ncbi:MAG: hypothetical protein H6Q70_243 [Firmicutes bacterium]|nr:hypothetical protein [Bacillota bacterium]
MGTSTTSNLTANSSPTWNVDARCFFRESGVSGAFDQVADKWASQHNLKFNADHWTDNVSHGELLRAGTNQKLEISNINRVDFLIQGVVNGNYGDYVKTPWDLGVIHNYR